MRARAVSPTRLVHVAQGGVEMADEKVTIPTDPRGSFSKVPIRLGLRIRKAPDCLATRWLCKSAGRGKDLEESR